jgi:hypothetical protein
MDNRKIAEAFGAAAEGLTRAATACVAIANEFGKENGPIIVPQPDPKPPVPPPGPLPKLPRIWGWNLGAQNHYQHGKIFTDALYNADRLIGQDWMRPATVDRNGQLTDGMASTRIYFDSRLHGAATYRMSSGSGSPTEIRIAAGSHGLDDRANNASYQIVTLNGDSSRTICTPGGESRQVNPQLRKKMKGVGTLRFMDLRRTNHDTLAAGSGLVCHHLSDVPGQPGVRQVHPTITPDDAILVAKACGATGIWWNVHFHETPAAIREAMQVFAEQWTGELYVEYSNENWNNVIEGDWINKVAKMFPSDWPAVWNHFRMLTSSVGKIVHSIVPSACVVMGTQSARYGITDGLLAGDLDDIDAIAIAPYIGNVLRWPDSTKNLLVAIDAQLPQVKRDIAAQKQRADSRGLRLLGYEAGSHIWAQKDKIPADEYARMMEANASEEMASIYDDFATYWEDTVGDTCCMFNNCDETSFAHYRFDSDDWQPRGKVIADRMVATI